METARVTISASGVMASAGTAVLNFPPLVAGDLVTGIRLFAWYTSPIGGGGTVFNFELRGCNSPPASAAEARNGTAFVPVLDIPMTLVVNNATYTEFVVTLSEFVPLFLIPEVYERFLSLVVVEQVDPGVTLNVVAFLQIERKR